MSNVTRIVESIEHGDRKAADDLLPLVYEELRRSRRSQLQPASGLLPRDVNSKGLARSLRDATLLGQENHAEAEPLLIRRRFACGPFKNRSLALGGPATRIQKFLHTFSRWNAHV